MALVDDLKIIDGVFVEDRFLMRGINGTTVNDYYKADGLRSFGRLIQGKDPVTIRLDDENSLYVPVEINEALAQELFTIADELEKRV